jgi:hypothetical protein
MRRPEKVLSSWPKSMKLWPTKWRAKSHNPRTGNHGKALFARRSGPSAPHRAKPGQSILAVLCVRVGDEGFAGTLHRFSDLDSPAPFKFSSLLGQARQPAVTGFAHRGGIPPNLLRYLQGRPLSPLCPTAHSLTRSQPTRHHRQAQQCAVAEESHGSAVTDETPLSQQVLPMGMLPSKPMRSGAFARDAEPPLKPPRSSSAPTASHLSDGADQSVQSPNRLVPYLVGPIPVGLLGARLQSGKGRQEGQCVLDHSRPNKRIYCHVAM